jgi:hypothetical protein
MGVGRIGLAGLTAAVLGLGAAAADATPVRHAAAEAALGGRVAPAGRGALGGRAAPGGRVAPTATAAGQIRSKIRDLGAGSVADQVVAGAAGTVAGGSAASLRAVGGAAAGLGTAGTVAGEAAGGTVTGESAAGLVSPLSGEAPETVPAAGAGTAGALATAPGVGSRPKRHHRHRTHHRRHHAKRHPRRASHRPKTGASSGTRHPAKPGHHTTPKTPKTPKKATTKVPKTKTPKTPKKAVTPPVPLVPVVPKAGTDVKTPKKSGVTLTGPALMLAVGIAALKGTGYDVDETIGHDGNLDLTQHGSVDPGDHSANLDATGTRDGVPVHTDVRQIGDKLWTLQNLGAMQSSVGGDPAKWMSVDRGELNRPDDTLVNLSGATDPLDIAGLMAKVTNLEQASPTYVTGLVDLTSSTGVSAPLPEQLAYAGEPAAATPFTAAVDGQGRLIELRIDADTISPDLSRTFTFSQFGAPSPVQAPPSDQVIEAPDSVYQYFNGR